jgi:hypothetical protein
LDIKHLKKYAAIFSKKKQKSKQNGNSEVFHRGPLQTFIGTFEKWTKINVQFRRAMPFLFPDFCREVFKFGDKRSHKVGFSKCGLLLNIPLNSAQPRKGAFSRVCCEVLVVFIKRRAYKNEL